MSATALSTVTCAPRPPSSCTMSWRNVRSRAAAPLGAARRERVAAFRVVFAAAVPLGRRRVREPARFVVMGSPPRFVMVVPACLTPASGAWRPAGRVGVRPSDPESPTPIFAPRCRLPGLAEGSRRPRSSVGAPAVLRVVSGGDTRSANSVLYLLRVMYRAGAWVFDHSGPFAPALAGVGYTVHHRLFPHGFFTNVLNPIPLEGLCMYHDGRPS